MLSVKQEAVNSNVRVIGLIQLENKPVSTTPEEDALFTRPFALQNNQFNAKEGLTLVIHNFAFHE